MIYHTLNYVDTGKMSDVMYFFIILYLFRFYFVMFILLCML